MKTNITMTVLALSLIVGGGCKARQEAATTQTTAPATTQAASASTPSATTPEQLGALGAEIKKHPNDAHKLITERGLSEESFAAAVRKVSEDPAAAKRYTAAYKASS
jgi:hypothetical protein